MVGIAEKRLQRLFEPRHLVAESRGIGRKVEAAAQGNARLGRGGDGADEADRCGDRDRSADVIAPRRHQNRAPRGRRIGRLEGRLVVRRPVARGAIVAHVDPVHHLAQEGLGDILDHHVLDPHHTAVEPGQVEPEVAVTRREPPGHVDPAARAGADNRLDGDDLAIGHQLQLRSGLDPPRNMARGAHRIAGDPHRGQVARDRLHPRANPQIGARHDRRLRHRSQLLHGKQFAQLEAGAEIRVRRHQRRVHRPLVGVGACRAVLARPEIEPLRESRRHQRQPVGNRHVHLRILLVPARPPGLQRPSQRARPELDGKG
ncbi:hypothetical protein SDC9_30600 [bioreactor metagenome]|uniref:Uncharacterized protein n=1 Tax=bioreactor metagenome TaxID=1076179 RepID=A0A644V0V8_9ZZZZ